MRIIRKKINYRNVLLVVLCSLFGMWYGYDYVKALRTKKPQLFTVRFISWHISNLSGSVLPDRMVPYLEKEFIGKNMLAIDGNKIKKQLYAWSCRLQAVSWSFDAERNVHISLQGYRPLFFINDMFVLLENRAIVPHDLFEDEELEVLPTMQLQERLLSSTLNERIFGFLLSLKKDFLQNFSLFYKEHDYIVVTPQTPGIYQHSLVCNEKKIQQWDKKIIPAISDIFKNLEERSVIKPALVKRQKRPFIFDLRFKDQVIVKLPDPFNCGRGS